MCTAPLFFWLFELSLAEWNYVSHTYLTRTVKYFITLDKEQKERKEKKYLHQHCGPQGIKLIFLRLFCLGSFPFCRYVAYNLESSFVVPLLMIRKIQKKKKNRNKTDTRLEERGLGDTHITSDMCTGIHISLWHRQSHFLRESLPGGILPYKRLMWMCRWMG